MTLGDRVRAAREAAGLTQVQLADRLGWPRQHLHRIETGAVRDPGVSRVLAIARALGVTVDELAAPETCR